MRSENLVSLLRQGFAKLRRDHLAFLLGLTTAAAADVFHIHVVFAPRAHIRTLVDIVAHPTVRRSLLEICIVLHPPAVGLNLLIRLLRHLRRRLARFIPFSFTAVHPTSGASHRHRFPANDDLGGSTATTALPLRAVLYIAVVFVVAHSGVEALSKFICPLVKLILHATRGLVTVGSAQQTVAPETREVRVERTRRSIEAVCSVLAVAASKNGVLDILEVEHPEAFVLRALARPLAEVLGRLRRRRTLGTLVRGQEDERDGLVHEVVGVV